MLEGITILETQPITEVSFWVIILGLIGSILVLLGITEFDNSAMGPIALTIGIIMLIVTLIGIFTFFNIETGRNKYTVTFDHPYTATELYDAGYKINEHLPYSDAYVIEEIKND